MRSRLAVAALIAAACHSQQTPERPTQSTSTLALSQDDTYLYAVDADNETLSVLDTRSDAKIAEVKVGAGAHLVTVGPDDTVYVANRYGRSVSVVRRGEWSEAARWTAGEEPVGLTVSADGKTLYVVNAVTPDSVQHGAVLALDTASGETLWTLPVGEEPRSIALVGDSHAAVTLLKAGDVQLLDLSHVAVERAKTDTFERMNKTALQHLAQSPQFAVDTQHPRALGAVVASPGADSVHAIGITARAGPQAAWGGCAGTLLAAPAMLTFDRDGNSQADDVFQCTGGQAGPRTIMIPPGQNQFFGTGETNPNLIQGPSAVAIERSGRWMYVAHQHSNNVAIISTVQESPGFNAGAANVQTVVAVGSGPNGIAVRRDGTKAYVLNAFDHTVSVLGDDGRHGVMKLHDVSVGGEVLSPAAVAGRKLFFSAVDSRMSSGVLGAACATCHIDNGQEDGHVWTFAEGKRQTMSLVGGRLKGTEPFHWDGRLADLDVLMKDTTTTRMGGHGTTAAMTFEVNAYLETLRAPVNPKKHEQLTAAQARGAVVYQRAECGTCHGGAKLTNNLYAHVGTDESNGQPAVFGQSTLPSFPNGGPNVPSLLGLARTAPYLHDGTAATLRERITQGKAADLHGKTSSLSEQDVDDLVEYLETL